MSASSFNCDKIREVSERGSDMSAASITTVIKMLEMLPESAHAGVIEHLSEYLTDLQDELEWNHQFERTQASLVMAAQRAKREIADGLLQPLDHDEL
jgi:hypothetical protein